MLSFSHSELAVYASVALFNVYSITCFKIVSSYVLAAMCIHDDVIKWKHLNMGGQRSVLVPVLQLYRDVSCRAQHTNTNFNTILQYDHTCIMWPGSQSHDYCHSQGQTDHLGHPLLTLKHWGPDKWTPFRRRHFQMHFLEWKCLNSDLNFTEVCSQGFN